MNLNFVKFNGRWFADVPNWIGSYEDLEMVMGADDFLDEISKNTKFVDLELSFTDNGGVHFSFTKDIYDGSEYDIVNGDEHGIKTKTVWLCRVCDFFFHDNIPSDIFVKVSNHPNNAKS